jgi:hypothetical protein
MTYEPRYTTQQGAPAMRYQVKKFAAGEWYVYDSHAMIQSALEWFLSWADARAYADRLNSR